MKHSANHIADRIRLMITTKQFQVGELLPSTRDLGRQLEASFHTVRKAYHMLEDEGMIQARTGRGFEVIRQNSGLDKSERLETGAEKLKQLLEELIGYGLDEQEVEALFDEQINYMEWPDRIQTSASVGETEELARMVSEAIQRQVGVRSRPLHFQNKHEMLKVDALFVPIHLTAHFRRASETQRILPVIYTFDPDLLLSIIDRAALETIGLVAGDDESLPKLIGDLKAATQYEGSFLAGAAYGRSLPLFVRNTDLILYTEACARLVEHQIPEKRRLKLDYILSAKSAELIRSELWDQ
ncbi:MAG: GntR family transcriptional regulator [Balneolaceae bacterium]